MYSGKNLSNLDNTVPQVITPASNNSEYYDWYGINAWGDFGQSMTRSYGYKNYNSRVPLTPAEIVSKLEKEPKGFLATKQYGYRLLVLAIVSCRHVKVIDSSGDIMMMDIKDIYPWDEVYLT